MKGNQLKRCLEITRKLKKHPAAKLFLNPVDRNSSIGEYYYEVVDDPQDLTSIEERLKKKEYRSVREFKRDISTIWSNAIMVNGPTSYVAVIVNHLEAVFEKELKVMSTTNVAGWLNKVTELKTNLNSFLENTPKSISDLVPLDMMGRKSLQPLLPDDYTFIFKNYTTLTNQDQANLKSMIGEPQSEIDLTKLPLTTLRKAYDFIQSKKQDSSKLSLGLQMNLLV